MILESISGRYSLPVEYGCTEEIDLLPVRAEIQNSPDNPAILPCYVENRGNRFTSYGQQASDVTPASCGKAIPYGRIDIGIIPGAEKLLIAIPPDDLYSLFLFEVASCP